MKRFTLVFLLLLGLPSTAPAQKLTDEEIKDGFVSLFNGKDWAGLQFGGGYGLPDKVPKNWTIKDGLIHLTGGGAPHLGTQWDYEDFEFRLEWRAVDPKKNYNSGVYIRSGRKVNANQLNLAKGGEAGPVGMKIKGAKAVPDLQKPAGEWNEWKIRCIGDKVTLWCNDKLAWEATDFKDKKGYLGLQAEGAAMEFRNLRSKEIGWDNLSSLDAWKLAKSKDPWKLEGDVLVGGFTSMMTSNKKYKSCILRLEWKAPENDKASLFVPSDDGHEVYPLEQLKPPEMSKWPVNPAGQWNYLEVRCAEGKIHFWLNGEPTTDKGLPLPRAKTATPFSLNSGGVQFRNIRVKALD
jgi:hypothetical protein